MFATAQIRDTLQTRADFVGRHRVGEHTEHVVFIFEYVEQTFGNFVACRVRCGAHEHILLGGFNYFFDGGDQCTGFTGARRTKQNEWQRMTASLQYICDNRFLLAVESPRQASSVNQKQINVNFWVESVHMVAAEGQTLTIIVQV